MTATLVEKPTEPKKVETTHINIPDGESPLVEGETPQNKEGETPQDNFDFEKWLKEQPIEVGDALAARDEQQAKGLKSALEKERKSAQEKSRELEARERERQAAEEAKLAEQGKYKEILANRDKELDKLKASEKARVFRDETRQALKDNDLETFSDVLMGPREKVEDIIETGKSLRAMIDEKVEAEVASRLNTGTVPKGGGTPIPLLGSAAGMNEAEKLAFIKEHGLAEWTKLVQAGQGE